MLDVDAQLEKIEIEDCENLVKRELKECNQFQKILEVCDRDIERDIQDSIDVLGDEMKRDYEEKYPYEEEERELEYYSGVESDVFFMDFPRDYAWKYIQSVVKKNWNIENRDFLETYLSQEVEMSDNKKYSKKSDREICCTHIEKIPCLRLDALQNYVIHSWRSSYIKKREDWLKKQTNKKKEILLRQLKSQMGRYKKMKESLECFTDDYRGLWDMCKGHLRKKDFDVIAYHEKILKNEQSLKALADLLGMYRQSEKEYVTQLVEKKKEIIVNEPEYGVGGKRVGIEYGNTLRRVVPKEFSLLSDEDTDILFFLKYGKKQLLQYKTELPIFSNAEEIIQEEITKEQYREIEQGPVILCIDTSGSMMGESEKIAKLIVYVLAKHITEYKRKLYLINFSTRINCLDLSDMGSNIEKLIDFLCMDFDGGTDINPAICEGLRIMQAQSYKKSDLLVLSDGLFPSLSRNEVKILKQQKKKGSKFYSILIGEQVMRIPHFNKNWRYKQGDSFELLVNKMRMFMKKDILYKEDKNLFESEKEKIIEK